MSTLTRRRVLELAAGTAATTGLAAAESDDAPPRVVGTGSRAATTAARAAAGEVRRVFDFGRVGDAVVGTLPASDRESLRGRGDVRYVEPVRTMTAVDPLARRDGLQIQPWGVDRIDADVVHELGVTGEGVDVAVVDTGIAPVASDLRPNLGEGRAFTDCVDGVALTCEVDRDGRVDCSLDPAPCATAWADETGHGTHVAGTLGAVDDGDGVVGVAPDATLHAVKVLNALGGGSTADIAAGIEYVADRGWPVANLSLGGPPSNLLADAVRYASERGTLVVAAAGNAGPCSRCVSQPAAHPASLAVAATTIGDAVAPFSSSGPAVDIAAPGNAVCSTVQRGLAPFSGTSMATPHVAGAAALLVGAGLTPAEARSRLVETATDLGAPATAQGAGLVDAAAAFGLDSADDGTGGGAGCVPLPPTNRS